MKMVKKTYMNMMSYPHAQDALASIVLSKPIMKRRKKNIPKNSVIF